MTKKNPNSKVITMRLSYVQLANMVKYMFEIYGLTADTSSRHTKNFLTTFITIASTKTTGFKPIENVADAKAYLLGMNLRDVNKDLVVTDLDLISSESLEENPFKANVKLADSIVNDVEYLTRYWAYKIAINKDDSLAKIRLDLREALIEGTITPEWLRDYIDLDKAKQVLEKASKPAIEDDSKDTGLLAETMIEAFLNQD
jgi:hypothetical protein